MLCRNRTAADANRRHVGDREGWAEHNCTDSGASGLRRARGRLNLAALRPVPARAHGGDGVARDAGHLPDREHRAGRPGAGAARRHRGLEQGVRRRMARQMGPRSAAVGAIPDLPAAACCMAISASRSPRSGRCSQDIASSRRRRSSCRSRFLLALVVGIPLGIMAAVRRDSWIDHLARLVSLIGVSSPTFWLAFIMLALFYGGCRSRRGPGGSTPIAFPPPSRHRPLSDRQRARRRLGDVPRRARASRAAVDRAGGRDARPDHAHHPREHAGEHAAGLRPRRPRQGHARAQHRIGHMLPNALIPVVTLGGLAYANLLTGAVLTETIFSWPGLGRYTFRSAVVARFSRHHGHHAHRRGRLPDHQPADRHQLCAARPAGGAMSARRGTRRVRRAVAPVASEDAALAAAATGFRRSARASSWRGSSSPSWRRCSRPTARRRRRDGAPAAAVAGALARHRRARARRVHPPALRRAHLAHHRHRRRAGRRDHRHAGRRRRGLCARAARRADHAR